jgi:hypothetical protein
MNFPDVESLEEAEFLMPPSPSSLTPTVPATARSSAGSSLSSAMSA